MAAGGVAVVLAWARCLTLRQHKVADRTLMIMCGAVQETRTDSMLKSVAGACGLGTDFKPAFQAHIWYRFLGTVKRLP